MVSGSQLSIPDSQLSASSSYTTKYGTPRARLHTVGDGVGGGGWGPSTDDQSQWIQADFGE